MSRRLSSNLAYRNRIVLQYEGGSASFLMLGIFSVVTVFVLILWTFAKVFVLRETAGMAAEAGAIAAAKVLHDAFVSDITPEAYGKLEQLVRSISEDPLYQKGDRETAIILHTVPSDLRTDLLRGKSSREIPLQVLLKYKPFFTEQTIGHRLVQSFERHFDTRISPEISRYLQQGGEAKIRAVRFPVHEQIEVVATKALRVNMFNVEIKDGLHVPGRGHALHLSMLDDYQIPYDFSGIPIFQKQFDARDFDE